MSMEEELLFSDDEAMADAPAGASEARTAGDAAEQDAAARVVKRKNNAGAAVDNTEKHASDNQLDDGHTRLLRAIGAQNKDSLKPLKTAINSVNSKVVTLAKKQASDMETVNKRIAALENAPKSMSGGSTSAGSGTGSRVASMISAAYSLTNADFVPIKKRKVGVVGGFIYNDSLPLIEFIKSEMQRDGLKFDKVVGTGNYGSMVKILFACADDMWKWLVGRKGRKYYTDLAEQDRPTDPQDSSKRALWHGIDKYDWEIAASRKATKARELLAAFLTDKKGVPADDSKRAFESNDYADVILKTKLWVQSGAIFPVKIFELDRSTKDLRIAPGATAKLEGLSFDADISAILVESNAAGARK